MSSLVYVCMYAPPGFLSLPGGVPPPPCPGVSLPPCSRSPARTLGAPGCRGPGPGQQNSSTYPRGSRLPWAGPRAAGFQHVPWGLLVAVGRARAGVSGGRPGGRQQENLKAAAGGRQQQNTRFCDRWAGRRLLPKNDVFLLTKTAK